MSKDKTICKCCGLSTTRLVVTGWTSHNYKVIPLVKRMTLEQIESAKARARFERELRGFDTETRELILKAMEA